ncbi:hypothetical protein EV175_005203 [Coemansia sp. RSA 1933]|nr:hypothetical protein EV175_005203 [Coemansia sp. RSA 1933]
MEFTRGLGHSSSRRLSLEGYASSNSNTDGFVGRSDDGGIGDIRAHASGEASGIAAVAAAARSNTDAAPSSTRLSLLSFGAPRTERERMLWGELTNSQAEIQQLQFQIRSLLDINIRYAEQLQDAISGEHSRKRSKTIHGQHRHHYQHQQRDRDQGQPSTIENPLFHGQHRQRRAGDSHHADAIQQHAGNSAAKQSLVTTQGIVHQGQSRSQGQRDAGQVASSRGNNSGRNQSDATTQRIFTGTELGERTAAAISGGGLAAQQPSLAVADTFNMHGDAAATAIAIARSSDSASPCLPVSSLSILNIGSPGDQQQQQQKTPASLQDRRGMVSLQVAVPLTAPGPMPISAPVLMPGSISGPLLGSAPASVAIQPEASGAAHQRPSAPRTGPGIGSSSGISGRMTRRQQKCTAEGTAEIEIGDPELIPSIGKFESPRALYKFRERVRSYELTHGAQWREKMDSRKRQNWSRISAVHNRIMQLCGPSTGAADVERAIAQIEREMAESKATMTRYSQLIRKQLNDERRRFTYPSSQQQQQQQQTQRIADNTKRS